MNYPAAQYPTYPQQAAPQFPGFPPQQAYPAPVPVQPAVPLASGTIDEFYSQPTSTGGPAISWKGKPDGSTYQGLIVRDVTNGDVIQETDPQTKQPKFYRDGRPMFAMKIQLQVAPSPEFPEGEATLFVRGQLRDELARAMAEVGISGAPRGGDALAVTLTHRKPSRGGGFPQNIFAVRYAASGAAPAQPAAPVAPSPVPVAAPQPAVHVGDVPAPVQQPVPVAQTQSTAPAPAAPTDLSPDQAALLAKLTGQQPA